MKSKLVVIEGVDGSGKKTQASRLVERLKNEGVDVRTIDFPVYNNNLLGGLIGECLIGEHGDFLNLDAKITSVLYAADRFESSQKIIEWLDNGLTVIVDRYAGSNQIHQGGKISDKKKRKELFSWLNKLEFEVFKIPKPDIVVYLDVPYEVSKELLTREDSNGGKEYKKGKKDVTEHDENYARNSRESALDLCNLMDNWVKIDCCKDGKLMSIEKIHEEVYSKCCK
jgi:dTMP kinase